MLFRSQKIKNLDLRWYLIFDATSMTSIKIPQDIKFYHAEIAPNDKKDTSGAVQKNIALSKITEGWVYALDDDNIIHPNFPMVFLNALNKFPDKKAFVFSQANYKNDIIDFYIVANNSSGTRAKIYARLRSTNEDFNGLSYYINGNIVRDPVITRLATDID